MVPAGISHSTHVQIACAQREGVLVLQETAYLFCAATDDPAPNLAECAIRLADHPGNTEATKVSEAWLADACTEFVRNYVKGLTANRFRVFQAAADAPVSTSVAAMPPPTSVAAMPPPAAAAVAPPPPTATTTTTPSSSPTKTVSGRQSVSSAGGPLASLASVGRECVQTRVWLACGLEAVRGGGCVVVCVTLAAPAVTVTAHWLPGLLALDEIRKGTIFHLFLR